MTCRSVRPPPRRRHRRRGVVNHRPNKKRYNVSVEFCATNATFNRTSGSLALETTEQCVGPHSKTQPPIGTRHARRRPAGGGRGPSWSRRLHPPATAVVVAAGAARDGSFGDGGATAGRWCSWFLPRGANPKRTVPGSFFAEKRRKKRFLPSSSRAISTDGRRLESVRSVLSFWFLRRARPTHAYAASRVVRVVTTGCSVVVFITGSVVVVFITGSSVVVVLFEVPLGDRGVGPVVGGGRAGVVVSCRGGGVGSREDTPRSIDSRCRVSHHHHHRHFQLPPPPSLRSRARGRWWVSRDEDAESGRER